jgi:SAM-dependent methyltransferase
LAERRSARRARREPEWIPEPDDQRRAHSQVAGEAVLSGHPDVAQVLESALRQAGPVERATHGFHAYPAGLHADAARILLSLGHGDVLDPFCGGGTVLVEALLAGREALGLDISPVACLVARARTVRTTAEERTAMRSAARNATETARFASGIPEAVPPLLRDWYDPGALAELCALRPVRDDALLRAVYSSILVKTSYRESETSRRRLVQPRPPGTTAILFHRRTREYGRQLEALEALAPPGVRARVHREDAREQRERDRFGLVLTSPPYPGVYDYLPMQLLRAAWLGLDVDDPREVGSRREFSEGRGEAGWRQDTARWVRAAARALAPGGRLVVVIGDGNVSGQPLDAWGPLDEAATWAGLARVARATVERWDGGLRSMRPEHAGAWERP